MSIVLSLILTGGIAWLICAPFLSRSMGAIPKTDTDPSSLDQKDRCIQVLKDLELDLATGKIDESDYGRTRAKLSLELGEILKKLDSKV